jgi:hypothetical protein
MEDVFCQTLHTCREDVLCQKKSSNSKTNNIIKAINNKIKICWNLSDRKHPPYRCAMSDRKHPPYRCAMSDRKHPPYSYAMSDNYFWRLFLYICTN